MLDLLSDFLHHFFVSVDLLGGGLFNQVRLHPVHEMPVVGGLLGQLLVVRGLRLLDLLQVVDPSLESSRCLLNVLHHLAGLSHGLLSTRLLALGHLPLLGLNQVLAL